MTHNGEFCQKCGLDLLQTINFGHFACFFIFSPKMRLKLTQNGQFHNFSHLLPPKHLIFGEIPKFLFLMGGGGYISKCFEFFNFFELFHTKVAQNDTHNGKFCQKSGLDWIQMANFGHFAGFSIFSSKMRLRLTRNGQFHPIYNLSHLLPQKHLISGEISKIFILGGVTLANFLSFSTFSNPFIPETSK